MAVNLSEFSIRYPEFPKYLWDSPTPYSDVIQMKKDRRNPEHTKRPLNAFMLFAKIQREFITSNCSCNHSEISKALGKLWQDLSKEEKDPFIRGGKTLVELHRIEYPDYKYRPRKKGQTKDTPLKSATAGVAKKSNTAVNRGAKATSKTADQMQRSGGIKQENDFPEASHRVQEPESPVCRDLTSTSPTSWAAPSSPLSYGSLSPSSVAALAASPDSGLSMASPESYLHMPYSPVPSSGSSSGYDSELPHPYRMASEGAVPLVDEPMQGHRWSPLPEPDMAEELRDLEVTPLDESSLLNPLTMFPVLDLNGDDLDDLQLSL